MGGPERLIQKMRDKPKAPLEILIADDHSVVQGAAEHFGIQ